MAPDSDHKFDGNLGDVEADPGAPVSSPPANATTDPAGYHGGSLDPEPQGSRGRNTVEGDLPHDFSSVEDFQEFRQALVKGLRKAGYKDVVADLQGSSVTGKKHSTGRPFGDHSDFDIALSSPTLFNKAVREGMQIGRNPARIGPLTNREVAQLGLTTLRTQLSRAGSKAMSDRTGKREIKFLLFKDRGRAVQWSKVLIPLGTMK